MDSGYESCGSGLYSGRGRSVTGSSQLLTDHELYHNVIGVLPNLRSISARNEFKGSQWTVKKKKQKHGFDLIEFDGSTSTSKLTMRRQSQQIRQRRYTWAPWSTYGSTQSSNHRTRHSPLAEWPNAGVPYAAVAQVDLHCQLDEAMELLFSNEDLQFDASMRALWGKKKYKRGDLFLSHSYKKNVRAILTSSSSEDDWQCDEDIDDLSQPGWLAVHTSTLHLNQNLTKGVDRKQQLCCTSYTQRCVTKDEAFYLMKSLPRHIHEQLMPHHEYPSALRGNIDHIAVGYHLQGSYNEAIGNHTKLIMCAYASTLSGTDRLEVMHWRLGITEGEDRANSEAKQIIMLLAKATRKFQRVIFRRRLGRQTFTYFPMELGYFDEKTCKICQREFGLFRKGLFCQICGHLVCRDDSRKYEVEPVTGRLRKNRICRSCVVLVGSPASESNGDLLDSRGRVVLSSKASSLSTFYDPIQEDDDEDSDANPVAEIVKPAMLARDGIVVGGESSVPGHQLAEALFSGSAVKRAKALEVLKDVVHHVTKEGGGTPRAKPVDSTVVDKYLEVRLRISNIASCGQRAATYTRSDSTDAVVDEPSVVGCAYPLAQTLRISVDDVVTKDTMLMEWSSQRRAELDSAALDAICAVSAKRLRCSMAYVAMVNGKQDRIVGSYNLPNSSARNGSTFDTLAVLVDNSPFVMTNPMIDARFRHIPIVHELGIQFYTGFPIKTLNDVVIAYLCVVDTEPRESTECEDYTHMESLTKLAADLVHAGATQCTSP